MCMLIKDNGSKKSMIHSTIKILLKSFLFLKKMLKTNFAMTDMSGIFFVMQIFEFHLSEAPHPVSRHVHRIVFTLYRSDQETA